MAKDCEIYDLRTGEVLMKGKTPVEALHYLEYVYTDLYNELAPNGCGGLVKHGIPYAMRDSGDDSRTKPSKAALEWWRYIGKKGFCKVELHRILPVWCT